jgi:hypothetical protein
VIIVTGQLPTDICSCPELEKKRKKKKGKKKKKRMS